MAKIEIGSTMKSSTFEKGKVTVDEKLNKDFDRTTKIIIPFVEEIGNYLKDTVYIEKTTSESSIRNYLNETLSSITKKCSSVNSENNYSEFGFSGNDLRVKKVDNGNEYYFEVSSNNRIFFNTELLFNVSNSTAYNNHIHYGIKYIDSNSKAIGDFSILSLYDYIHGNNFEFNSSNIQDFVYEERYSDTNSRKTKISNVSTSSDFSLISLSNSLMSGSSITKKTELNILSNDITISKYNNGVLDTDNNYSLFKAISLFGDTQIKYVGLETPENYKPRIKLIKNTSSGTTPFYINMESLNCVPYRSEYENYPITTTTHTVPTSYGITLGLSYSDVNEEYTEYYNMEVGNKNLKWYDITENLSDEGYSYSDVIDMVKLFCSTKISSTNVGYGWVDSNTREVYRMELWANGITLFNIISGTSDKLTLFKKTFTAYNTYPATGCITLQYPSSTDSKILRTYSFIIHSFMHNGITLYVYADSNGDHTFEFNLNNLSSNNFITFYGLHH